MMVIPTSNHHPRNGTSDEVPTPTPSSSTSALRSRNGTALAARSRNGTSDEVPTPTPSPSTSALRSRNDTALAAERASDPHAEGAHEAGVEGDIEG